MFNPDDRRRMLIISAYDASVIVVVMEGIRDPGSHVSRTVNRGARLGIAIFIGYSRRYILSMFLSKGRLIDFLPFDI